MAAPGDDTVLKKIKVREFIRKRRERLQRLEKKMEESVERKIKWNRRRGKKNSICFQVMAFIWSFSFQELERRHLSLEAGMWLGFDFCLSFLSQVHLYLSVVLKCKFSMILIRA